jgi:arsenate reductase (glutaredoxin)
MSTTPVTVKLFGIPNCDTVKKARTWLSDHAVEVVFHDFKKMGSPTDAELHSWFAAHNWDTIINRKGTTWRKLDAHVQDSTTDAASAKVLAQANLSVIKRPVVAWPNGRITVGFAPPDWEALLNTLPGRS